MKSIYRFPALYTLEGYPDAPNKRGAYRQQDTYRNQNFSIMGDDWGVFNFLRPSRLRESATTVAAGAGALAALVPITAPVTAPIAASAAIVGGASQAIYQANRGGTSDPPNSGTGYQPGVSYEQTEQKKSFPIVPVAVLGAGIAAAVALA